MECLTHIENIRIHFVRIHVQKWNRQLPVADQSEQAYTSTWHHEFITHAKAD